MRLGPITGATLIVRNLERSLHAYCDQFGLLRFDTGKLPLQRALDMGDASLAHAATARLRAQAEANPRLTLIEMPHAPLGTPYARRGWLALMFRVNDVDLLGGRIDGQTWQMLSAPVGDSTSGLRSMPVAGPDGEVLHLIQPRIPLAGASAAVAAVDGLHGAVLGAAHCGTALGFYEGLGLIDRWRTQARKPTLTHEQAADGCPAAFAQLAGGEVIEIDQLPGLPANDSSLRSGLRLISFARSDRHGRRLVAHHDPSARILAGPEGEAIELL